MTAAYRPIGMPLQLRPIVTRIMISLWTRATKLLSSPGQHFGCLVNAMARILIYAMM